MRSGRVAMIASFLGWVLGGGMARAQQQPMQLTGENPSYLQATDEPPPMGDTGGAPGHEPMVPGDGAAKPAPEAAKGGETAEPEPLLWKGFLYGDPHFRDKPRPIGSPIYFEDPYINSDLRLIYVWHKFPDGGGVYGGDLSVWAAQIRVALTERLQFTATCDGYSKLHTGILKDDEGWNDLAVGLKYALWVDHENDFLLASGLKWRLSNGHANTLHGNVDELTPYISAYKGLDKWNFIGHVAGRLPCDEDKGNYVLSWDAHVDYELFEGFFPLLEFHGVHYLSDADRLPLKVGGLDYANIGSNDVAGRSAYWGGVGFRWNIVEHVSFGAAYEFPLRNPDKNDLFDQRVTTNVIITF